MNSQNVEYGLGQLGSVFLSSGNKRFQPPSGMVIISILAIDTAGATFTEMIPDNQANAKHVGSTAVTNSTGDGGTLHDAGEDLGGAVTGNLDNITDVALPQGATVHGRWSSVMLKASGGGSAILYFGY